MKLHEIGRVARAVLSSCWGMEIVFSAVAAGLSGACIIPPDLEPAGADAGPSSPPGTGTVI